MILVFHIQPAPLPDIDLFLNASELYAITRSKTRMTYWYSTSEGTVELSVNADERITDISVAELLKVAHTYAISRPATADGNFDTTNFAIESLTGELRAMELPLPKIAGGFPPCTLGDRDDLSIAYRTYMSGRELNSILAFPSQQEYAAFSKLLIVSATASALPDSNLHRITAPVRRRYRVLCPEGVSPSATFVDHGQSLTLIYTAPRHYSYSQTVVAGEPSQFTHCEGSILMVEPLSNTDIKLRPIAPAPQSQKAEPAKETANTPEAIIPGTNASSPDSREITLRLRLDDDRIIETTLTLDGDSPEYRLLRDGEFHGYRARRMQVQTIGSESYLIDMRMSVIRVPEPKNDTNGINPPQYAKVNKSVDNNIENNDDNNRSKRWIFAGVVIIAVCAAIWAVARFMPGFASLSSAYAPGEVEVFENTENHPDSISLSLPNPEMAEEATAQDERLTTDNSDVTQPAGETEQADIAYLNSTSRWESGKLQSDTYRNLIELMAEGQLEDIARHPYFSAGICTNREARSIAVFAWRAKGSGSERGNILALKATKNKSVIDIHKLYEDMARLRPSDPNNTPCPAE